MRNIFRSSIAFFCVASLTIFHVACSSTTSTPNKTYRYYIYITGRLASAPGVSQLLTYEMNPTSGALTFVGSVSNVLGFLAVDPSQRFLVSLQGGAATITGYKLTQSTGMPVLAGSPASTGTPSWGVAIAPSGAYAYAPNSASDSISAFTIDQTTGGVTVDGPAAAGSAGAGPQNIAVGSAGKFVYAANNGTVNGITMATANASTGALISAVNLPLAYTPQDLIIDSSDRFLYTTTGTDQVEAFSRNTSTGALASLGTVPTGTGSVGLIIDSGARFIYTLNGIASTVSGFKKAATGTLVSVGTDVAIGSAANPQRGSIDPTGIFLFTAATTNQPLSTYRIDQQTGGLTLASANVALGLTSATSIAFAKIAQ